MKNSLRSFLILSIVAAPLTSFSQKSVEASQIIEQIRRGESISIEDAVITGDLDFTFYFEKKYEDQYSRKKENWNDNSVKEMISGKIVFVNCVFRDGVLAYIHDEKTNYTFIASFENTVVFQNCIFEKESDFKYSSFEETADFNGSVFEEEALFKYAKFQDYADFGNSKFDDDANFKYAKFQEGLNFSGTIFKEDLNLKYAKINGEFNSKNMDVQDDLDVKYTKVNGESFSKYLIKSK